MDAAVEFLRDRDRLTVRIAGLPAAWQLRQFRDGNRILIHALPGKVETILHPTLKNQINNERIVEILEFTPLTGELRLEASVNLKRVELHSPDLSEPRPGRRSMDKQWTLDPTSISRYFIVECFL